MAMGLMQAIQPFLLFFNDMVVRHRIKKHVERHTATSKPDAATPYSLYVLQTAHNLDRKSKLKDLGFMKIMQLSLWPPGALSHS